MLHVLKNVRILSTGEILLKFISNTPKNMCVLSLGRHRRNERINLKFMMWKIGKKSSESECGWLMRTKFLIHWRTKNISTIFCSWIFLFLICHSVLTPWASSSSWACVSLCKIPLMSHFSPYFIFILFLAMNLSYINCDNMLIFLTIYVAFFPFILHVIIFHFFHIKAKL